MCVLISMLNLVLFQPYFAYVTLIRVKRLTELKLKKLEMTRL